MSNENWLSTIPGTRRLNELVIPGSHDAGVYGDSLSRVLATKGLSRCQSSDIYNQAAAGSRMFDCRVFLRRTGVVSLKKTEVVPTMGHFAGLTEKTNNVWGKGSLGAYGGTLVTVVDHAIQFVTDHPTEFLILRFSHTYCPDEVGAVIRAKAQNNVGKVFAYAYNMARCQLDQFRGKVAMVFASEFNKGFNAMDGFLPFRKYDPGGIAGAGLCTCGIYKSKSDMKKVHATASAALDDHATHADDSHLLFVYWQQTGGNVQKNTESAKAVDKKTGVAKPLTGGSHANLGDFCDEVVAKVGQGTWKRPNVISHDFVKSDTCDKIIALNTRLPNV